MNQDKPAKSVADVQYIFTQAHPEVPHPMSTPECRGNLDPGGMGGSKSSPLVKRIPLIVIETEDERTFFTDDGLFFGSYKRVTFHDRVRSAPCHPDTES